MQRYYFALMQNFHSTHNNKSVIASSFDYKAENVWVKHYCIYLRYYLVAIIRKNNIESNNTSAIMLNPLNIKV